MLLNISHQSQSEQDPEHHIPDSGYRAISTTLLTTASLEPLQYFLFALCAFFLLFVETLWSQITANVSEHQQAQQRRMRVYESGGAINLEGATLVLPAVAFANIGELSIDLLVCTLKAQPVARLDSDNLLACVGNNAYQLQPPGLLATALELYQVPGSSVFLLQQRAPAIPGRQKAFAAELAAWAQAAGFGQLLLLFGLDAQYRREQQLEGSQLRYLSSSTEEAEQAQSLGSSCKAAGIQQLESDVLDNEKELHGLLPPWPVVQELQSCGVPHTLLSAFAAEGDNTADAMRVAGTVLSVLGQSGVLQDAQQQQQQQQLHVPCSWAGLLGRRMVDSTLF